MLRQAMRERKQTLGQDHKDTLESKYWLGLALYHQNKYSEAEEVLRQAVRGRERTLGQDHKDTLESKYWLGLALYHQNKYSEAEEVLRQAVRGRERTLGQDHKDTLESKYWLGLALYHQNKYSEAEEVLRQAVRGRERTLGQDHEDTLTTMRLLEKLHLNFFPHSAASTTAQEAVASRLSNLFFEGRDSQAPYTDSEINEISTLLEHSHQRWSKVPRTYVVLRTIGYIDLLDKLLDADFSDYWFPVTNRNLPGWLPPAVRTLFVSTQSLVLTKSIDLEKGKEGQHGYYKQGELPPFKTKGLLGGGGFAQVEKVLSLISFKEYAKKQVLRTAAFRGQRKEHIKRFIAEIEILKRLKHRHIVELVGSYTDSRYMALIMSPVAEMDLGAYLRRATISNFPELRTFFGCLATALEYLHEQSIRHNDIKPTNILIDRGNILFADFDLSFDFIDADDSTTISMNIMSPRYCAPEVAQYEPSNTMSDIWSLGVVFMEMVVVLKGKTVQDMDDFFGQAGSQQAFIRTNLDTLPEFATELEGIGNSLDNRALDWARKMLSAEQRLRPTASSLVASIVVADQEEGSMRFCGICCGFPDEDFSGFLEDSVVTRSEKILSQEIDQGLASTDSAYGSGTHGKSVQTYSSVGRDLERVTEDDESTDEDPAFSGSQPPADEQGVQNLGLYTARTTYSESEARTLPLPRDKSYIADLAADLFGTVKSYESNRDILDRISEVLPDLLRAFALKLGHKAQDQKHRDVSYFVHKYRLQIKDSFEAMFPIQDVTPSDDGIQRGKFAIDRWINEEKVKQDPVPEQEPIPENDDNPEPAPSDPGESDDALEDGTKSTTDAGGYRDSIVKTAAYSWLVASVQREATLTRPAPNVMEDIRKKILGALPSSHKVSRRASSQGYKATFELDWDPLSFVTEQQYAESPDEALERAITLTGSVNNAQAVTTEEYLTQTWPATGKHVMQLVTAVIRKTTDHHVLSNLPDGTELDARIDGNKFIVTTVGTGDSLVEIGQQFAWLGAALRSPPRPDELIVAYCWSSIVHIQVDKGPPLMAGVPPEPSINWNIQFEVRRAPHYPNPSNGQCWFNLFRNPVVVEGYPVLRRQEYGTGLEISLNVVAELAQARRATIFDGRLFVKGYCAMLVLARHLGDLLIWHLLFNEDESRISYLDPRVSSVSAEGIEKTKLSDLGTSRHVVGWCSDAKSYTGEPDANYTIDLSGLPSPNNNCRFNNVRISQGPLILPGKVAIPKKAKRGPHHPYFDRLRWVSKRFVVLYDVKDTRAWLVNAVSALLHLVRTSLEAERTDEKFGSFYYFTMVEPNASVSAPSNRAIDILMKMANREQKLWKESAICFEDRVDEIWCTLEMILEFQVKINEDSTCRGYLEGFEFMDMAQSEGEIRSVFTTLDPERRTWVDFTRKINAITLFGTGFGELIKPADPKRLCSSWVKVPEGNDYLTVHVTDIEGILNKRGNPKANPWQLIGDVYWHTPDKIFGACQCRGSHKVGHSDRVQVLLSKKVVEDISDERFNNPQQLEARGAVIFGHSAKCTWHLEDELDSNGFGSNRGSSTTGGSENFAASSSTWPKGGGSSGDTKSLLDSGIPWSHHSSPAAEGKQRHAAKIEGPNAHNPPHHLHKTETDEDSHKEDTVTGKDPQTSSRPVMDDQNNLSRWDQITIYSLVFMFLPFLGLTFYWTIVSISALATWLYYIFVFRKKHNGVQSDSQQALPSRSYFTIWATWFAKGFGLLVLVTWCALLSPIHIFAPTLLDAWTTYSDHSPLKSFDILYDPGDAGVIDVFAIHGLGSNPSSAWTYRDNGTEVYWLRDILPKEKGFENIRVTILNHQTRWDSHCPDIDFGVYAKMMLDDIEHLHQENRPIIFIAHSFGGLLLKKSLVLAITRSKRVAQMTKGILFLGVPHHGTKAAFIASLLACTAYWRGSSTTLLEYMSEGSPAVMTLDKEFYDIYARPSPTLGLDIPYICNFLEMKPERIGKLSLGPTVNTKSGSLRYAEDVLLDTDHRGLNKFQSSADPNFEKFKRHFTRAFLHGNN